MIDKYDKLVRDKIPEIIKQQGDSPVVEILDNERYNSALNQKLKEEVAEYLKDYSLDELADILEVICALVKCNGLTMDDVEKARIKKHNERGGFDSKIFLVEVKRN